MIFNLYDEIVKKIHNLPNVKPKEQVDVEFLKDVIDAIDDMDEDDTTWDTFSLPLQCWYNDNLIEIETAAEGKPEESEIDYTPLSIDDYDPSNVELECEDLELFDKSIPYLFVILAKGSYHIGFITSVDLDARFIAIKTEKDNVRSFSTSEVTAIRLVPDRVIALEVIEDLKLDYGGDWNDVPPVIEGEPAEESVETVVKKEKPVKELETVRPKKKDMDAMISKVRKKESTKTKPMTASYAFKEQVIKDPKASFTEHYDNLRKRGFSLSEGTAKTMHRDVIHTLRVLKNLEIIHIEI